VSTEGGDVLAFTHRQFFTIDPLSTGRKEPRETQEQHIFPVSDRKGVPGGLGVFERGDL